MTKFDFKKYLPTVAAVLIFLALVFMFFNPLWEGKQVSQHDVKTHQGMSKEILDFRESTGEEALWTNSMFGGMPAYQISVQKNENLIQYVDLYLFRLRLPRPADYVFLYMIGFFILLRVLKVDPWLSIVGAVAFGFSSYSIIILEAGHNSKAHAIGYMAPVLAMVIYTFRSRKYLLGGVLFSLFMALELYTNHPQISYYLGFIVLAYGAGELVGAIREKELMHFSKSVGVLFVGLILALAVNLNNYLTTNEYTPYTIRGASELTFDGHVKSAGLDKDYATQWSYGIDETLTLMIPNAKGGASVPLQKYAPEQLESADPQFRSNLAQLGSYFGEQPMTSGPVYVGAIVFFLFILSLFVIKGRFKWALLAVTLISIFLSWGHNWMAFTDLFFDYFPVYNKFRTVSMILVIAQVTMALMAFLALDELLRNPQWIKENKKAFIGSFAATGGLSLLVYLSPGMFTGFLSLMDQQQLLSLQQQYPDQAGLYQQFFAELENVRLQILKADSLRSFMLIAVLFAGLWVYSLKNFNKVILIAGVGVLVLVDMMGVASRYLNKSNYEREAQARIPYMATPADQQILADQELDFRVYNTTVSAFNDASTSYYHKSIGGYHGAKLRRYQDVIEHHLAVGNMQVLNMLNTKYFIVGQQGQAPQAQMNPGRLGNAWFVQSVEWAANADQEIIHLGRVIEIKALGDIANLKLYGRPLRTLDTLLLTTPLTSEGFNGNAIKIDLSRLPLQTGATYILGNDPMNVDSNFIDISKLEGGNTLGKQMFEVRVIYDFDAAHQAVVDQRFASYLNDRKPAMDSTATIKLVDYKPNHLTYQTETQKDQLAVFSEIYYDKGWDAYIDGQKTDYIRANYILRSMWIPAGKHTVEFKFEPSSYVLGKNITLVSSIVLLLLVAAGMYFQFATKFKTKE